MTDTELYGHKRGAPEGFSRGRLKSANQESVTRCCKQEALELYVATYILLGWLMARWLFLDVTDKPERNWINLQLEVEVMTQVLYQYKSNWTPLYLLFPV